MPVPYPDGFPCALRDSYAFTLDAGVLRGAHDVQSHSQRRKYRNMPMLATLTFRMTTQTFRDWSAWVAALSFRWFTISIPTPWMVQGNLIEAVPVQLLSPSIPHSYTAHDQVTAQVQVRLSPSAFASNGFDIGNFGDWIIARRSFNPSPDWIVARTAPDPAPDWIIAGTARNPSGGPVYTPGPQWPEVVPLPDVSAYQWESGTGIRSAQMQAGNYRVRDSWDYGEHIYSFEISCRTDAMQLFINWANTYGYDWFDGDAISMFLTPSAVIYDKQQMRLVSDIAVAAAGHDWWAISVNAELDPDHLTREAFGAAYEGVRA